MSIGLCLSGGGAKGAAHIGVLQALEEEGVKVDYISGCSSGSIVASLYAIGYSPKQILGMFTNYCKYITDYDKTVPFKILGMAFTGRLKLKGLAKGNNIEYFMRNFCYNKRVKSISDVKMPLAIPTVDIKSGEIIYFLSNKLDNNMCRNFDDVPSYEYDCDLASVVRASISLPCIFEPKYIKGRYLIDGGIRMNSPVDILKKQGADKVITVSFDENKKSEVSNLNIVDVTLKSFDIMGHEIEYKQLMLSDIVIYPKMSNVSLLECSKITYAYNAGYEATKKNIKAIKALV